MKKHHRSFSFSCICSCTDCMAGTSWALDILVLSNYIIFKQVGKGFDVPPKIVLDAPKVGIFVIGIIMIVGIAVAVFIIFRNLTVQRKLTGCTITSIANITHELKSPLSSIQLYLETLSSKT